MKDELLLYYERELSFLRQMGAEFAGKYPKIASRLVLEPDKCEDPHVERMLEGFALLAGRIHLKIDDDFPEVTQALLNSVYPHYLRPIPSMSVVEFEVDAGQVKPETGLNLPRGAAMLSRPVDGVSCRFRTCYDMHFWPVTVTGAQWRTADRASYGARTSDAAGVFAIALQTQGGIPFSKIEADSLRFYINGDGELAFTVHELITNSCAQVAVCDAAASPAIPATVLPASAVQPVGFAPNESAIPYTNRSFAGYRTIQEYFSFPEKFLFFEVRGLRKAFMAVTSDRVELQIAISSFERSERKYLLGSAISERTFRLWSTPVINLFARTAEPILLDPSRPEYPVIPDASVRHAAEVFSIEEVLGTDPETQDTLRFAPFHSMRHNSAVASGGYWQATRRNTGNHTELMLSLVDPSGLFLHSESRSLTVRTLCTNADLPARLPVGAAAGDFEMEGALGAKRIVALVKPTATLRPPAPKDSSWRLISQLSLNYLSLVEDGGDALREMLRLYNFGESTHVNRQIDGIVSVRSRRHYAPLTQSDAVAFARGTQVEMEFDEEQFVGGGAYLFAAVLEDFLAQYVSVNSFCQLLARTRQRKETLKQWPPRAGRKVLL